MTINEKKKWLERYANCYDACLDCKERREAILLLTSSKISLTPTGHDITSEVERKAEKRKEIDEEYFGYLDDLNRIRKEISSAISRLTNSKEMRVLRLRYLNLCEWSDISTKMDRSMSWCYRLCSNGIRHLEIR